jgi:peptidoglycan hydrolase-like protein with peptidoglycan-binding domain
MAKNDNVKSLQALLNSAGASPVLVIDGLFGSKTLAALQSIYGKTQIDSADDLNNLKKIVSNQSMKSSNLDWAWKLIDAYNSDDYSNLLVSKTADLNKITQNFQGAWKDAGRRITLAPHNYNLDDYALRAAMSDGTLRIEITSGDLAGMYSTDPNIQLSDYFDIVS